MPVSNLNLECVDLLSKGENCPVDKEREREREKERKRGRVCV